MSTRPDHGEPWPPLIVNARLSRWVIARDLAISLIGWFVVVDLLHDFWLLIYDWLKDPIFVLAPEDTPDWDRLWWRIHPFVYVSTFIVTAILVLGIWRRKVIARNIAHHVCDAAHEDAMYRLYGVEPADVTTWHAMKCVDVHVDDSGHIRDVVPRP